MSDYNEFLSNWTTRRVNEVCRVLYLFTKYLLKPREGYKAYDAIYINGEVTKYVIQEIFGCGIKQHNLLYTENFQRLVRETLPNCFIENEVYDHIWNYVMNLKKSLTEGIKPEDTINQLKITVDEPRVNFIITNIYDLSKIIEEELLRIKSNEYKKRKFLLPNLTNEQRFILIKMGVDKKDLVSLESFRILQEKMLKETEQSGDWTTYKKFIETLLKKASDTLENIYKVFLSSELYELSYPFDKDPVKRLKENNTLEKFINILNQMDDEDMLKKANEISYKLLKKRVDENVNYISHMETSKVMNNDDFNNSFMNSILYLLITISDWLEVSVGEDEIKLAISIILPSDLKISIDKSISEDDDKINQYLMQQLEINGVGYDNDYFYMINETLKSINKNEKIREQINNRVRFFSDNLKKLL